MQSEFDYERLKQPQVFIDTQNIEERYAQGLYEDYLKEQLEDYKSRCKRAIEYVEEIISSTKGVLNDYSYHKEHNKQLIELLNEDVEMYQHILNILQNGSENQ